MERFDPPNDYLTQVLPAMIGATIDFMAIIELTDHLGSAHVRRWLLPLCVVDFIRVVLILISLLLWFQDHDLPFLQRVLLSAAVMRIVYTSLDAFIYVRRVRSILVFYGRWRVSLLVFIVARWALHMILACMDLKNLSVRTNSAADFFAHVGGTLAKVTTFSHLIGTALQALLVDGVLLYVIVKSIRATGRRVAASAKRIIRIALLIMISVAVVVMRASAASDAFALLSLVAGIMGSIILPLGVFVNIDLYILDLALFISPPVDVVEALTVP